MQDDVQEQTARREHIGCHAWVRTPVPVDLRHSAIATAVARRRARRHRP